MPVSTPAGVLAEINELTEIAVERIPANTGQHLPVLGHLDQVLRIGTE